jgi:cellulose synthase operon protein C
MKTLIKYQWMLAVVAVLFSGCSNEAVEKAEKSARHLKSAQVYEKQGQYRAAMLEARNVIQLTPEQSGGYQVLTEIYNQIGAYGLTQKLLEDAQANNVALSQAMKLSLAEAYIANKKFRSAIQTLKSEPAAGVTKDEQLAQLRLLGEAYLYLKDFDNFSELLNKIASDPEAQSVYLYLIAAKSLAENKPDLAEEKLAEILQLEPANFDALTLMGDIALYHNNLDKAETYYTKALSGIRTTDVMLAERTFVLRRLIDTLVQLGRSAEAFTYQKILSDANPGSYAAQQKFSEAMELYAKGDLDAASKLLKELREEYPQDSKSATLLGLVAQQQGEHELASQLFDEFMDAETVTPSVIQAAALAKLNTQKSDEAVAMLKAAAEQQPNNAGILSTYGLALVELNKDNNEATMILERSLALNPKQPRLRIALAKSYLQKDKKEQALAQLKKAYTEAPEDFLIQQVYYRTLAAAEQKDELKQVIDKFVANNPNSAKGVFFVGWYELGAQRFGAAKKAFERAVAMGDQEVLGLAHAGLAQSYTGSGQILEATQAWEETIKANPAALKAYGQWLITLQRRGQVAQAEERLAALKLEQHYWQPDYAMARLAFELKDYDRALSMAKQALSKKATIPEVKELAAEANQQLGFQYYQQGDVKAAKAALLKAAEWMPSNITYIANLIKIELDADNNQGAQKILDQFSASDTDAMARHYLQGRIFEQGGKLQQAMSAYQSAWAINPTDLTGEAMFNLMVKAKDDGEAFLETWKKALPKSSKPLLFNAMLMQSKGELKAAEALYVKALELSPNIPAALNNLAWIYHEKGDERALVTAKKAYELAPNSAAIMDTYAWMLVQSGSVAEGYSLLEQAVVLAPDNAEIKEHLAAAKAKL